MRQRATIDDPGHERLQVRLFGTCEVVLDGRRLGVFEALRLQRFLALIVLREGVHHRSRMAFELWPESTETQARTNFRKLVHDLRRAVDGMEAFVDLGKDAIRWRTEASSAVDVLSFRNAISAGDYGRAGVLYKGDLLPDCYDDWILHERAKLRAEAQDVYRRLAKLAARKAAHVATVEQTTRLLEIDPSDEIGVRLRIDAYLSLGDRAAALRTYRAYAEDQEHEFGVSPQGEVAALYERSLAAIEDRRTTHHRRTSQDEVFVGRQEELGRLNASWMRARRGDAGMVVVTGEPGIGKSRLALEFCKQVEGGGSLTASTRAYQAAGRPSWGPVIDFLRSPALNDQVASVDPVWRTELARLMPEFVGKGGASDDHVSGQVAQRHRLFDAVGRAIVGDRTPRLLIVDDLQWCDRETVEFLGHLIRSHADAPILIVGTMRAEELGDNHPVLDLQTALGHQGAVTTIALKRFDRAETEALAAVICEDLNASVVEQLWAETEGNPLFIIEMLRAGPSSGDPHLRLTPTMRAVLTERLKQTSQDARHQIDLAAVFGCPFSVDAMRAALGWDEAKVVGCLDELWRRGVFREHGTRYDFSHDKLRDAALELITPVRQRQLHKSVAQAIIAVGEAGLGVNNAQLAAHYDRAGMIEQAIEAYRDAGARAVLVSAVDEAVGLYERALELLAEVPNSSHRDGLELKLRIALGSPLVAVEGYGSERTHQLYERAAALCRRLGRPVDPPILRGLGLARLQGCRFEDCDRLAKQLVGQANADFVARTEGLYLLGVNAFWQGRLQDARHYLEAALDAYDERNRNRHLAHFAQDPKAICLMRLGLARLWSGDPRKAEANAQQALNTAIGIDHLMTVAYVLTYATILAVEAEDDDRLRELLDESQQQWKRLPDRYLRVILDAIRGWSDVREGSVEAVGNIVAAVARLRAGGESLHLTYALLLLARARRLRGELVEAKAATDEAVELSVRTGQRYLLPEILRIGGEIAHQSGDIGAARAGLQEASREAKRQGALLFDLRTQVSLVRAFQNRPAMTRLREQLKALDRDRALPAFRAARDLLRGPAPPGTVSERPRAQTPH